MRRFFFFVLMGCTSLVGVGDLTVDAGDASNDVTPPPSCGSPGPTDGMVAYFPFDEDAGQCAKDCVNGQYIACAPLDAGPLWWPNNHSGGGAIWINPNVQDCLHVTGFTMLDQKPFSVSAWILTKSIPTTNYGTIIGRHRGNGYPGWHLGVRTPETLELHVFDVDGNTTGVLSTPGLAVNLEWQHVVMSYTPDAGSTILVGDASATSALPSLNQINTEIVIGCRADNGYDFNGYIDELRIYDHVLSQDEIQALEQ